jgi:lipopolysaccharide export LptBFGC system permease protein LptF
VKRIDYHDLLLRDFLVNLARAVAVFMIVTALFAMMAADLRGLPVQLGGWFLAAVLDAVLPLSLLVATLFTVGPRAHFKELNALTSAGFSMFQITWPLFAVAGAAAAYSWLLILGGVSLTGPPAVTPGEIQTSFHAGLAFPAANVFGVAAGIILASSPNRKSIYSGFLPAFFVVVAYRVVDGAVQIFGRHGVLPPVVAGWLGTVLAAGVLWWMWKRAGL